MNDQVPFNATEISKAVAAEPKAILPVRGKIRVYVCGGGATKVIGSRFEGFKPAEDQAELSIVYLDSSYSNINKIQGVDLDKRFYHVSNPSKATSETDGGGKDRAVMVPIVRPHLPKIVEVFPPLELNLIVCTGGGATGSTVGPMLAKELISRDKATILLMVGCEDSEMSTRNTVNTWRSIEQMVKSTEKDWAVFYAHNSRYDDAGKLVKNSQVKSDEAIVNALIALAHLGSRRNEGLDTMDVYKAINISEGLRIEKGLSLVTIHTNNESLAEYGRDLHVDALLSVFSGEREEVDITPSYDGYGISKSKFNPATGITALHFAFSRQGVFPLFEKIRLVAEELNNKRTSAVGLSSISAQGIGRVVDIKDDDMVI